MINRELELINHLFQWVITTFPSYKHESYRTLSTTWLFLIDKWIKNEGLSTTISRVKLMRLHTTRFISGSPLKVSIGFKIDKSGLPTAFGPSLKRLASGDIHDKRLLLTLLTVTRCFKSKNVVDFTSITTPGLNPVSDSVINEIASQVTCLSSTPKIKSEFVKYHVTTKAGPNGLALDYAIRDLEIVEKDNVLYSAITTIGGSLLQQKITALKEALDVTKLRPITKAKTKNGIVRRLSIKADKEGKTRIFAILDYWSQTSLITIHKELSDILKNIPMDCTFDQTSRLTRLTPSKCFYSFDLKDATDRFPIDIQMEVLSRLTNPEIAKAWRQIMVGQPFYYDDVNNNISYQRGQPMGAYSSWPLFALSHHCLVQAAAKRAGVVGTYSNYMLLGDDIVIADDLVAKHYEALLQQIEVPLSQTKTHVSQHTFEFAKRWIHKVGSLSGLPLVGLLSYNGPETILAFLSSISRIWPDYDKKISRSEIRYILRGIRDTLLPKLNVRLEELRIYEALQLPFGRDFSTNANMERIWSTFRHFAAPYFSCNRANDLRYITSSLDSIIGHVKINMLKEILVKTSKNVDSYYKKLIMTVRRDPNFNSDMLQNLPHYLQALPVIEVAKQEIAKLHDVSQDIRNKLNTKGAENLDAYDIRTVSISSLPQTIGFNPLTLVSKDAGELAFAHHSQLAKKLKRFFLDNESKIKNIYESNDETTAINGPNQSVNN